MEMLVEIVNFTERNAFNIAVGVLILVLISGMCIYQAKQCEGNSA